MFRGTTILAVRRAGEIALGGDGQVTFENMIMKQKANKIRKLYKGKILAGFAGAVADALTLFEKFEGKIEQYQGNLSRAALELAKEWRQDKVLRKLEALMLVADKEKTLIVSGGGDVIEPDREVVAIGSGAGYAEKIVNISISITSSICIYTNDQITIEKLNEVDEL